jgi:hypothetical protein
MTEDKEVKVTLHASTILLHDSLYPEALNFDNFARMLDKVVGVIVHDRMEVESEILKIEFECTSNDPRNFLMYSLAHHSLVLPPGMCRNIINQFLDCSNQEALLQLCKTRNIELCQTIPGGTIEERCAKQSTKKFIGSLEGQSNSISRISDSTSILLCTMTPTTLSSILAK